MSVVASSPVSASRTKAFAAPVSRKRLRLSILARRAVIFLLAMVYVGGAIHYGLILRQWLWDNTQDIRFQGDIRNALNWGTVVVRRAQAEAARPNQPITWRQMLSSYYRTYDRVAEFDEKNGVYDLDYPPLRLLVVSAWVKTLADKEPGIPGYRDELVNPLLRVNTALELVSALGIFLVVRHWRRTVRLPKQRGDAGVAATYEAKDQTGGDMAHRMRLGGRQSHAPWLLGLLAATLYWFNPAILLNAHAWPQWDSWVVPFYIWAIYLALRQRWFWAGALLVIGGMLKGQLFLVAPVLLLWPIFAGRFRAALHLALGFVVTFGVIVLPWLIEWNFNWWTIGLEYGTHHYLTMNAGQTYNAASIMSTRYRWQVSDPVDMPAWLITGGKMELRTMGRVIYAAALLLCGIGCALHERRRHLHLLVALSAPWLLMYALNVQMHERYLLWAGGVSAILVGVSAGWGLLHLLLGVIATLPMLNSMISSHPREWGMTLRVLNGLYPGLGWAVLLLAGIFLYYSLVGNSREMKAKNVKSGA